MVTDADTRPASAKAGRRTWKVVETDVLDATPVTVPRSRLSVVFHVQQPFLKTVTVRGLSRSLLRGIQCDQ